MITVYIVLIGHPVKTFDYYYYYFIKKGAMPLLFLSFCVNDLTSLIENG